jgi:hypothetical protein
MLPDKLVDDFGVAVEAGFQVGGAELLFLFLFNQDNASREEEENHEETGKDALEVGCLHAPSGPECLQ